MAIARKEGKYVIIVDDKEFLISQMATTYSDVSNGYRRWGLLSTLEQAQVIIYVAVVVNNNPTFELTTETVRDFSVPELQFKHFIYDSKDKPTSKYKAKEITQMIFDSGGNKNIFKQDVIDEIVYIVDTTNSMVDDFTKQINEGVIAFRQYLDDKELEKLQKIKTALEKRL